MSVFDKHDRKRKRKALGASSDKYKSWQSKVIQAKLTAQKLRLKELAEFRDMYEGIQWGDLEGSEHHEIVDNMVYMVVSTLAPSIGINRPEVFIKANRSHFDGKNKAGKISAALVTTQTKVLLNYLFDKLHLEVEFIKQIADSLIAHEGYNYVGYDLQLSEVKMDDGHTVDLVDSEDLICKRFDGKDFIKDTFSMDHDLHDARWIGLGWKRPLEDVKKDKRFKNTDLLEPTGVMQIDKTSGAIKFVEATNNNTASGDEWAEYIEGWDIWDKQNGELLTLVEGHDDFLYEENKWPLKYNGNGFPVDILWYNFNPKRGHALADTAVYKTKQKAVNILSAKILDHADRLSAVRYILNKKMFPGGQAVSTWANGPSGSWMFSKGDAQAAVQVVSGQGGNSDLITTLGIQKADILQSVGVSQFEVGAAANVESASEANEISKGTSSKRAYRQRAVERHEANVLAKLVFVAQQVGEDTEIPLDDGQFTEVANVAPELLTNNGPVKTDAKGNKTQSKLPFMMVKQDMLVGEFQYKIKLGSTSATDADSEKRDGLLLMEMAEKNPLLNKIETTKIAIEKLGFMEFMTRIMRDPSEVAQEASQARDVAVKEAMIEPQIKSATDLQKTAAKTASAEKIAAIKAGSENESSKRKQQTDGRKNEISAMDSLLKLVANKSKKGDTN